MKKFSKKEIGTVFTVANKDGHQYAVGEKVMLQLVLPRGGMFIAADGICQILDRSNLV